MMRKSQWNRGRVSQAEERARTEGHMVRQCGRRGWQGPDHVEGGMEDDHVILRASSPVVCLPLPSPQPVGACLV